MFVICERPSDYDIRESLYELIHRYDAFSLIDYQGKPEELDDMPHRVTDDLPIFVNGQSVSVPLNTYEFKDHPRTLVRFAGPIIRPWINKMTNLGVGIHFFCPPYGACIELPKKGKSKILKILQNSPPFIVGAIPYTADHCGREFSLAKRSIAHKAGLPENWIDIVLFRQSDRDTVKRELAKLGARVIAESRYKFRLIFDGALSHLRRISGVKLANHSRPSLLAGSYLEQSVGMPDSPFTGMPSLLDGHGQIVAVADTGFDRGYKDEQVHPDFAGRVLDISSWPINESWDPYVNKPKHDDGAADNNSGHGTHVAGLAVGNGIASHGNYRGLAPGASLVFQAMEQFTRVNQNHENQIASGYYLSGRPLDLKHLFGEAREIGARIHVNAWGDPVGGSYTDDCYEVDDFLVKNQDALVLFAAGNDGADKNGDRRIDATSIYAPACAKNTVAIGATEGPREGVGLRVNWGAFKNGRRNRFAHRDDRDDAISGEPEHVALISSAGPTRDGRIKPDLCAPGTNLAAARSQATKARGWGLASPMPWYMYYGGTSMSTGVAGGYFALLRQAWQQQLSGVAPSGAALKALGILSAKNVIQRGSEQIEPKHIAGFGRINLQAALPILENRIRLIDHREPGLSAGQVQQYPFTVHEAQPLRAVLVWYDAPGEYLINNLNLSLANEQGVLYWGNHLPGEVGSPDEFNNVEVIDVPLLQPGHYQLRVVANNVPKAPQTFALVFRSPKQLGSQLPLIWIKGVGKVYAQRLAEQGINNYQQLIGLSLDELQIFLKQKGYFIQRIYAKLILLEERLQFDLPDAFPGETSLRDLLKDKPDSIDSALWQRVNRQLVPLIEVFDEKVLGRIQLRQLFEIQTG